MPTQALRGNVQKIQASDTYETHGNTGEGDTRMTENTQPKKTVTRRQVLAMAGCGVGGLVVGGVLAKWGVVEDSVASGRIAIETTPTKMIVTDRARCSGCQRCEMMCTLKNDGRVCQNIARVRVWENYYWGTNPGSGDGAENGNCQFTVEHCKQCKDAKCMEYCPVHAIHADEETGARVVDADVCIGCGMCHMACPWNMPVVDTETGVSTKCISCGRCAEQCPNGAIKFIDWKDIADEVIAQGIVRTATLA
ncbi:MAG TPA: 4Fe-4S binding protein [Candidatus Aveggerthella stercoripullorum]|jgi:Fe-S-cluster-containing dehydrogenase component|uniref:4Fe-4S binding protein n=1 Tax=Candidatus Aveggerthella stercoripullorum TaxID=2840688 RepID=A0A9D0ZYP6_9ACTN|nr:4Fe-4S binding protein [Candidatus Aveggerthella stercoripullorum]